MEYLKLISKESEVDTEVTHDVVYYATEDNKVIFQECSPYKAIDLGLSSGTKWANMNVGATSETDYGLYFQWGDTVGYTSDQVGSSDGKKYFYWDDYKFGTSSNLTKYNSSDNLTTLDSSDDAATVNMGSKWKMPTQTQFQELIDETTNEWTNINDVYGYKFTSKKDSSKYVFFPASGGLGNGSFNNGGSNGSYWSSSVDESFLVNAWTLSFYSGNLGVYGDGRCYGLPVRGVLAQ